MKTKLKTKAHEIAKNPKTQQVLMAMKPEKSMWGFLGIVLLLIVPEIVAFLWGIEISAYAKEHLKNGDTFFEEQYYQLLLMIFEEGGSWFNLAIGIAFLVWFFF